jgi:hypothetical protein
MSWGYYSRIFRKKDVIEMDIKKRLKIRSYRHRKPIGTYQVVRIPKRSKMFKIKLFFKKIRFLIMFKLKNKTCLGCGLKSKKEWHYSYNKQYQYITYTCSNHFTWKDEYLFFRRFY